MITLPDNMHFVILIGVLTLAGESSAAENDHPSESHPNILMIVLDDMNDWISLLDDKAPIKTPNLQRLANRGMLFTRAYCASPACNPSRSATLTGLRPTTTGIYGNSSDWRRAMPNRKTIMQQFMAAGYDVQGAGKIFHHKPAGVFHDDKSFHGFLAMRKQSYPPNKLNGAPEYGSRNTDWGEWPLKEKDAVDIPTIDYCIKALTNAKQDRPLFLACGLYKPHSPFFAPAKYHLQYREVELPTRNKSDWEDLPNGARLLMANKKWFWDGMQKLEQKKAGSYHDFIRSYSAAATFADAQIGRLIDALDKSSRSDNTIIVLWSDHGFHLGEKDHIEKFALWEKSTHIPLIIVAPGITTPRTWCDRPVDLASLYPTLIELGKLPAEPKVDGRSITPLLCNGNAEWTTPAITTYMRGNHTVRSERWRYIHYADGSEELYDHREDNHEWTNLLADSPRNPDYVKIVEQHRKWLPKSEAKQVANFGHK